MRKLNRARRLAAGLIVPAFLAPAAFGQNSGSVSATAGAAPAEADAAGALQEIVVTATRRESTLSKTPLSVSAYDEASLDKVGAKSIEDVVRFTPGIDLDKSARYNASQSNITIRGIRSTSGVPTTGIYIDDTPVQIRVGNSQSASNPYPRIFDLDRVEVLRGPQGTLFGAGSVGGAVRFITAAPNFNGYKVYARSELSFTDSGDPSYEAGLAAGGPIIDDKLAFRASVWHREDGGWVNRENYAGQTVNPNANVNAATAARLALTWKANDTLAIAPSLFYQSTSASDTSVYVESISNPAATDYNQNNPLSQPSRDQFSLPALKVQWDFGGVTLISNSSYLDRRVDNRYDGTSLDLASEAKVYGPPPPALQSAIASVNLNNQQKVFTEEVRVQNSDGSARLNWVAGLFYAHSKVHDFYGGQDPSLLDEVNYGRAQRGLAACANLPACFFGVGYYNSSYILYLNNNTTDEQTAGFAQVDFKVTDKLKVTVGERYAKYEFKEVSFAAGTVIVSPGSTSNLSQSDKPSTPKVGVSYQADNDNLLYADASKGYRIGGEATPVGARCASDGAAIGFDPDSYRTIKPDSDWAYEVGSKNRLLNGRLQLDTSIYRINWNNVQTQLTLPSCGIPTTLNMGDAISQGFDFTANFQATTSLLLGVAVGYDDAHYTTTTPGAGGVAIREAGEPLGVSPWTAYLNAQYNFGLWGRESYVRGDYTYTSHDNTPLDTASPIVDPNIPRAPSTRNLGLRLGMQFGSADVSVFAQNVTNDHPELARYEDAIGAAYFRGITERPRTIGITATYRY